MTATFSLSPIRKRRLALLKNSFHTTIHEPRRNSERVELQTEVTGDCAGRSAKGRCAAQDQACSNGIVGFLRAAVCLGKVARAQAPSLCMARGVRGSRDDRRARGLVCG